MCQLNFKSDFLLKNYLSKIENKHEWMCIIFGVMSFRYSVNFQSIYKWKWFVQLHGTEQQAYWTQKVWDDPQCGPRNWKCKYTYQLTLWYILCRGKYLTPPQIYEWANFNVSNYLPSNNCVWANSRRSKTGCKFERVKITLGENNPVYSI